MRAFSSLAAGFRRLHPTLRAALVFAFLLGAMFGDVLTGQTKLLSVLNADLATYFAFSRAAAFAEIKAGSVPLWNPYLFSGTPFQASFQSAFFYPVNWIHLALPSVLALNWEIVLNLFLAGMGMYGWARRSGCSFTASMVAGALLMFGMPYFLRISAGHLAPLGAMAWIPWIFAAIDDAFDRPSPRVVLGGIAVCALQMLAGHPQTVFTTAIAAGIYALLRFVAALRRHTARQHARTFASLLLFALGGFALAAIQMVPGLAISPETVRSRVSFEFASSLSFPPENFLTAFAPSFFGDVVNLKYWGRWYLWEMSIFTGVVGLVLALWGAFARPQRHWISLVSVALLFLLALGKNTPLLQILYDAVPGFDRLRSHSKFSVPATVLLVFLAAHGFDALRDAAHRTAQNNAHPFRPLCAIFLVGAVCLSLGASLVLQKSAFDWQQQMIAVGRTNESYLAAGAYLDPKFAAQAALASAMALAVAAATCALAAAVLWWAGRRPQYIWVFAVLAVAEIWGHAVLVRASFPVDKWFPSEQQAFAQAKMRDNRIIETTDTKSWVLLNSWMMLKKNSAWGYDPFILRRYAEVVAATQGVAVDDASYLVPIKRYHPLMQMLRVEAVATTANGQMQFGELPPALPHLALVPRWRILKKRDDVLAALLAPKFDPRREVILEQAPKIAPHEITANEQAESKAASVKLLSQTSDSLEIEATVSSPQMLLITDAYAAGWRAEPLAGSSQNQYEVLPANWAIRAVPLQAGTHRLRVFYDPPGWRAGKWISGLSLLLYGALWLLAFGRKRDHKRKGSTVEFDRTPSPVSTESI